MSRRLLQSLAGPARPRHARPSLPLAGLSVRLAHTKPALNVPASGGPHSPDDYCAALVRRLDPEAWLCSYFWPRQERKWWLAWRAFNLELHLISTTVSQPALAAIRFQFWKDALASIFDGGSVPQHPVAVALADVRRHRPVQRYYLRQMIDVRSKTLSLPPSSPSLEEHIATYSPLATALLLGPLPILLAPTDASTAHVSHTLSHLSHLLTTVSLLRSVPLLAQKRTLNIPAALLAAHGVVEEAVFREGAAAPGLRDAAYEIGTRGMDELITARRDFKQSGGRVEPAQVRPLFLAAVPAEQYLKRLERVDFDVFHPDLLKHDWKLAPTIWWRYRSGML